MQGTYRVVWEIDIEAESHREAAEEALAIQRDPQSIATVFSVTATGNRCGPSSPLCIDTVKIDLEDGETSCAP
jgi:hypothetical protein